MGKFILYTVQSDRIRGELSSTADDHGLTKYLGYRPIFCTRIDENSLAETWFKIWAASPRGTDIINIFKIDESECTPINLLEWTNECMCENVDEETIAAVLNDNNKIATDYLIKEIPAVRIKIPVRLLMNQTTVYERLLNIKKNDSVLNIFKAVQHSCKYNVGNAHVTNGIDVNSDSTMTQYGIMRMSGIVPFLWSIATKRGVNNVLMSIMPEEFNCFSFIKAQILLESWDNIIINGGEFIEDSYKEMHDSFIEAIDTATRTSIARVAKAKGIGRNDKCPCGSGKKFKHCHAGKGVDFIVSNPF